MYLLDCCCSINIRIAEMAQWWECSPSINASRVRSSDPASYVGWVCCWFSLCFEGFFSRFSDISKFQFDQHRGSAHKPVKADVAPSQYQLGFKITSLNNVTRAWAELSEVKVSAYCRFCLSKWLHIGVRWEQVYFTVSVGRKVWDSSWCPLIIVCPLNIGCT